ncbi:MAG: AI-2E family transporter [Halioglobus sp.]
MSANTENTKFDSLFVRNMLESALRIGLMFLLLYMTYDIIRPFLVPLLWGGIIAIAVFPLTRWVEKFVGGRRGLASTLVTLFFILLLVVPCFMLTESLLGSVKALSQHASAEQIVVEPPPAKVADIPIVGPKLFEFWSDANKSLESVLVKFQPQIKAATTKLVTTIGSGLLGVLMFVVSLIIAGGFMAYAESVGSSAHKFFIRIGGVKPGGEWASLCVATVRSVLQGVVGVAVIQALLCSVGLLIMGVPGAMIWSAIILFLAIAQLPAILVVGPIVAWSFTAFDTVPATIFAVWMLASALSDNILKPLLMGRGLDIPMPVILLGAIGGMVASGIIGLFAGAVVLSIWYKLFLAWLDQESS